MGQLNYDLSILKNLTTANHTKVWDAKQEDLDR